MIDHIGMPVKDIARATEFYRKALAPLGIGVVMEVSAEETGQRRRGRLRRQLEAVLLDRRGLSPGRRPARPCRLRRAKPRGGRCLLRRRDRRRRTDNGPPGLRPHYHANYYGAFVLDADGNNIEAVCHAPPALK